jgi:hypothetical protein
MDPGLAGPNESPGKDCPYPASELIEWTETFFLLFRFVSNRV